MLTAIALPNPPPLTRGFLSIIIWADIKSALQREDKPYLRSEIEPIVLNIHMLFIV